MAVKTQDPVVTTLFQGEGLTAKQLRTILAKLPDAARICADKVVKAEEKGLPTLVFLTLNN